MPTKLQEYKLNRRRLALDVERAALEREKYLLEQERHARARWWHEDGLIAQRLTWLITSQAILGAGYAYSRSLVQVVYTLSGPAVADDSKLLAKLVGAAPLVGMAVCAFLLFGIQAAVVTQRALRDEYPQFKFGVSPRTTSFGHNATRILPAVFILVWGVAFVVLR